MKTLFSSLKLILTLLAVILITSCETEFLVNENQSLQTSQEKFNFQNFDHSDSGLDKNDLTIDWEYTSYLKSGSELYYEYKVTTKNPGTFDMEGYSSKSEYRLIEKIVEGKENEYFLVDLWASNENTEKQISYLEPGNFSGMVYLYLNTGQKLSSENYDEGKVISLIKDVDYQNIHLVTFNRATCPSPDLRFSDLQHGDKITNKCGGGGTGCGTQVVSTYNYTFWYEVEYSNSTGAIVGIEFLYSELNSITRREVGGCASSDPVNNVDHQLVVPDGIADSNVDAWPWIYPHCSSWEYAMRGPVRGASVTGMETTFVAYESVQGGVVENTVIVDFPTLYFTAPNYWTNGKSATETAAAISRAEKRVAKWFKSNPSKNYSQIKARYWDEMRDEMRVMGGTVSTLNDYNMINPAPFVKALFTTGDCNT